MTPLDIERNVRGLYTNEVFLDFQEQVILSLHYFPPTINGDSNICFLYFCITIIISLIHTSSGGCVHAPFKVSSLLKVDVESSILVCSCNLFKTIGIPCRHVISYLTM